MSGYLKRKSWVAAALFGVLVTALPAQAASFDCAKAGTQVEKLICGDPEISKFDEELSAAYKTALQDKSQADAIKQAQKQWMKERNGCADADCLEISYRSRIDELKPEQSWERFLTVLSKDQPLCDAYKRYVEQETERHAKYDFPVMCRRSFGADYPEFKPVQWREIVPKDHAELAVEASHYMENRLPWSLPWKAPQNLSESEVQSNRGWLEQAHTGGGLKMWLGEADIGNNGQLEKLLKVESRRCNYVTVKPPRWMLPVMVLDESGKHLSEKTEWMLGVSVFPEELEPRYKDMHSFLLEAFDVFGYGGRTYFDRWEDEWVYNRLGKFSEQAHKADIAALTVYNIEKGQVSAVCRFKFNKFDN